MRLFEWLLILIHCVFNVHCTSLFHLRVARPTLIVETSVTIHIFFEKSTIAVPNNPKQNMRFWFRFKGTQFLPMFFVGYLNFLSFFSLSTISRWFIVNFLKWWKFPQNYTKLNQMFLIGTYFIPKVLIFVGWINFLNSCSFSIISW